MIFETHILENPLINYIESIFYFKGFKPEHSIERVVPTGHLFIIFELDGLERHTFDNKSLQPNGNYSKAWVSGIHKKYISISAHQDSEMFVIQFKTNGASPFFDIPISELNNKVIAAEKLFGNGILEVRNQILKTERTSEKFKIAENWLLNKFNENNAAPKEIQSILEEIQSKPISDSSAIIALYPNSQKHLIHQFKKYFGLTPKVLHRIFRFNEILKQIHNKQQLKWTDIAYEFGYADQSHFIKEFKEFSGFNPQEFINADHHKNEPNFFPLDNEG